MTSHADQASRRKRRRAMAAACLLFVLCIWPARWAALYVVRSELQFASTIGVMDESLGLGGQILGYNYYRHPVWVHWVAGGLAGAIAIGVPLVASVLLSRRLNGTPFLCGACGADIEQAGGLVQGTHGDWCCPQCQNDGSGSAGHKRWYLPRRLGTAVAVIGVVYVLCDRLLIWTISMGVLSAGEALGLQVPRISGRLVVWMSGGPFMGEGVGARIGNWMYGYAPSIFVIVIAGFSGAMTYWICAGPLGRSSVMRYRGRTCCGGCGYELVKLKTPRCPECGRVVGQSQFGGAG